MTLTLQTYKSEKIIQVIYKITGALSWILFFAILVFYRSNRGSANTSFPFNIVFTIILIVSIIIATFLFVLMKDYPRNKLWNLTKDLYLFKDYIIFNGKNIELIVIKQIVVEYNIKNIDKNGSENMIAFYVNNKIQGTSFFINNNNPFQELKKTLAIYSLKTKVTDNT